MTHNKNHQDTNKMLTSGTNKYASVGSKDKFDYYMKRYDEIMNKINEEIRLSLSVDDKEFKKALKYLVTKKGYVLPPFWSYRKYIEIYNDFIKHEESEHDELYSRLFWDGTNDKEATRFYIGIESRYANGWPELMYDSYDILENVGLEKTHKIIIFPYYSLLENLLFEKSKKLFREPEDWSPGAAIHKITKDIRKNNDMERAHVTFYSELLYGVKKYFYKSFNRNSSNETIVGRNTLFHGKATPDDITLADFFKILNLISIIAMLNPPKGPQGKWSIS